MKRTTPHWNAGVNHSSPSEVLYAATVCCGRRMDELLTTDLHNVFDAQAATPSKTLLSMTSQTRPEAHEKEKRSGSCPPRATVASTDPEAEFWKVDHFETCRTTADWLGLQSSNMSMENHLFFILFKWMSSIAVVGRKHLNLIHFFIFFLIHSRPDPLERHCFCHLAVSCGSFRSRRVVCCIMVGQPSIDCALNEQDNVYKESRCVF